MQRTGKSNVFILFFIVVMLWLTYGKQKEQVWNAEVRAMVCPCSSSTHRVLSASMKKESFFMEAEARQVVRYRGTCF